LHAASAITIAVIDTGADVSAPDLAAKAPTTWSVRDNSSDVTDYYGHGTFVSSLAAGSTTNGEGVAGFGGDAKLLAVQASAPDGTFTDIDESAAIVYAVDHGAKIINMSFGGPMSSPAEQSAIAYAAAHGVLLVAAAGNSGQSGNQPSYPAALLQPLGSNGVGGIGLAVAASSLSGAARVLFELRVVHLPGRPGRERLRRALLERRPELLASPEPSRICHRHLRLQQRHLLLIARGRRRGGAGLGRQPRAHGHGTSRRS
jgi:subtilisin family serine protease